MKSITRITIALAVSLLILAGCADGGGEEQSPTSNDADVKFAQVMIPHHEQAIEMSDVLLAKPDIDPQVTEMAETIQAAQAPEIETLQQWLQDWGAEESDSMGGMDHGSMDGMMSEEDMAALDAADGDEAARLFLTQMIEHHEGAVEMAQTHQDEGENPEALELSQDIIESQQAEIEQMRVMLQEL